MDTIFDYLYTKAEEYWFEAARDNFNDNMFGDFRSPVDLYLRKDGALVDHSKLTFNKDYMDIITHAGSSSSILNMYCSGYDAFLEEPVDDSILYKYLKELIRKEYSGDRFAILFSRYGGEDVFVDGDIFDLIDELSIKLVEQQEVLRYLDCSNMESLIGDVYDKLVEER